MSGAIVTDQFRILNSQNFIDSISTSGDNYYIFLGLPNPSKIGFGRTTTWNDNSPAPIDNFEYQSNVRDNILFGRKITAENVRRIVRRVDWQSGNTYEMYRHDYSISNLSPITKSTRLYDSNYYVVNSDFRVYICIDNGANVDNPNGNPSIDEPTFTTLEPSRAGESGDGYIWKYLYTISPSDIIKFDSTEYIPVPNNWLVSEQPDIRDVRENGDSSLNNNQIKKIYIKSRGANYQTPPGGGVCNILGDGEGGEALIEVNSLGEITSATIANGGRGYTYAIVDLDNFNGLVGAGGGSYANLMPIIPPSKGHGYDIYQELGADKILIYVRFDDSTKDFPVDTKFAQIGIIKNPAEFNSDSPLTLNQFSGLYSLKLNESDLNVTIGDEITQTYVDNNGDTVIARGYIASYDTETKVLKYFRDRSLYYDDAFTTKDYENVSTNSKVVDFTPSSSYPISPIGGTIDTSFTGSTMIINSKTIDLGVEFISGIAFPEINKKTGEIIYLDNRPLISRNSRQKEDIKVILEF